MEPDDETWFGRTLTDPDGAVLGTVGDVFVDDADQPVWVEVQGSGRDGLVLVPVAGAEATAAGVRVPHPQDRVLSAPVVEDGDAPSPDEEQLLRQHYALNAGPPPTSGADALGAGDRDAASMVLAEEELRISTEIQPTGTVRLRKWVETRTVREEVVLHQERVRVERQPVGLGDLESAPASAEIGEALYEVVLRDEQVVASKVTVPREVVRLTKRVVPETVLIEADLRHEEVALEGDVEGADVAEPLAGRS